MAPRNHEVHLGARRGPRGDHHEAEIGFGIVGTGAIADFHARALAQVEGARLVAATDRVPERLATFVGKYGGDGVATLEELLRRRDVDVVCVCTPSGAHGEVAVPALDAGKHVLCEKPVEVTLPKIDAMIAAAQRSGKHLASIFQARFGRGATVLKHALAQGRFGKLALCDAYVKWWRSPEYYESVKWRGTWKLDGGGALINQSIHAIDLLQWLVGMPEEVCARVARRTHLGIEAEDTAVATLKFPGGALGVIQGSTACWPGFSKRVEISGDRGSAVIEDDRLVSWKFVEERPEDEAIRAEAAKPSSLGGGAADPKTLALEGHIIQFRDLVAAIREGREPAVPGREGRNAVELILAIYESAKTGRTVRIGAAAARE